MTIHVDPAGLVLGQFLRRGDRIVWSQACGEPTTLVDALIAQAAGIGELSAFAATSFSGILDVAAVEHFSLSSMGAIGALRTLTAAHKLGVVPCHVSQVGPLIRDGLIGCDVAFVQVSPADEHGNHSYGLINDFMHAAVDKARVVIAEVNEQVPFTHGDLYLHASRITCAVHVSRTPVELQAAKIGKTDEAIARTVAGYIDDGSVLQVGIGAVPDAIMRLLHDRRDLGIHSGMLGDSFVDLVEAGVITNARKPFDQGISVTTALIGTRRLYQHAHDNRHVAVRSSLYTHDAGVMSKLPKLVTINSAVEVDLSGQVNAEQSGDDYVGGTGGQTDFVRAGARSLGGHAIMALPATAKGGKVSRVTIQVSGPVTTARNDVDVVVTEFGAAELKGQTLAERARRMVAIAHPDFREALSRAAHTIEKRGF
ncbi:MAG: acetyl-CoA hydrolase/transferase C-terminal domain-containing protein [Polyangiales bacterium]